MKQRSKQECEEGVAMLFSSIALMAKKDGLDRNDLERIFAECLPAPKPKRQSKAASQNTAPDRRPATGTAMFLIDGNPKARPPLIRRCGLWVVK